MALGGGTFLTQNKVLPGSYINFVNVSRATATLSDRGISALPIELDWGLDDEVIKVENSDFEKDTLKIFGYDYTHDKLKGLRDLFKYTNTAYFYKLNSGGTKASNKFATALYTGIRGNSLKTVISNNVDDSSLFDVSTYIDNIKVDCQTVAKSKDLIKNDYCIFMTDVELEVNSGIPFENGTNGEVTGDSYQKALNKLEPYSFNTLGCLSNEDTIKSLFVSFTKRLRGEMGIKFQTVIYNMPADYEGVINIKNRIKDENYPENALVYWVLGVSAGCMINMSNTNKNYNGEFIIDTDFKQSELEAAVKNGEFVFHKVGEEVHVLTDINSFVSFVDNKNEDFQMNQIIRVLDQIGNDIAVMFNSKYIGKIQNNADGRIAFWNDICQYNKKLETIQAIENFDSSDVVVEQGEDKKSVVVTDTITPIASMEKLYMTVYVK